MPTDTAIHFGSVKDLPAGSHNRARVHALAFWASCLVRVFGFCFSCFAKQARASWLAGAKDFKDFKNSVTGNLFQPSISLAFLNNLSLYISQHRLKLSLCFGLDRTFMLGPQQFLYRKDRVLDFASFGSCWILNQSMLSSCSIGKCPIVV